MVEDDPALRRVIAHNLRIRGHDVCEAECADRAICAVRRDQPQLLLLDINLPDRSGWDVLRELHSSGINVPAIILSAVRVRPDLLAEFRPLAYLPKPFPLEALLRLVSDGARTVLAKAALAPPPAHWTLAGHEPKGECDDG